MPLGKNCIRLDSYRVEDLSHFVHSCLVCLLLVTLFMDFRLSTSQHESAKQQIVSKMPRSRAWRLLSLWPSMIEVSKRDRMSPCQASGRQRVLQPQSPELIPEPNFFGPGCIHALHGQQLSARRPGTQITILGVCVLIISQHGRQAPQRTRAWHVEASWREASPSLLSSDAFT